jgi:hypothetical protein
MTKNEIQLVDQLLSGNHLSSNDCLELEKLLKKMRKAFKDRLNVNQ